jgi:hypothetical protein
MNIFVVDNCPKIAAQNLCNKHVVKMIVETAQMLSTAHRVLDGTPYIDKTAHGRKVTRYRHWYTNFETNLCKAAMINHPCTKWCMTSIANYRWLYEHGCELMSEYTFRYNKTHAMERLYKLFLIAEPGYLHINGMMNFTPFAQAMPDKYKDKDAVVAYRNYYIGDKARLAQWTKRNPPEWYSEGLTSKDSVIQYTHQRENSNGETPMLI